MILDGYYFAATGVSAYEFYDSDRCVVSVLHHALPEDPCHIRLGERAWTHRPADGTQQRILDADGREFAGIYAWDPHHFSIAAPGMSLTGRILRERQHSIILYTGMNDQMIGLVEYRLDRLLQREKFGEWEPRRYAATFAAEIDEALLALALAAPFLYISGIEVG